jgi:hypothetical protein
MNQVYCRALAALVVAAALAACGASDDEPQRVANDGDLATYGVESLFSVGVPSDWRTLTADEVFTDEVLETSARPTRSSDRRSTQSQRRAPQ